MKIGIISDTHIPKNAKELPSVIFDHFKNVDLILHAGDITELSVIDELSKITPNIQAVIGNMDPSSNQAVLPMKKIINADGVKIGLIHGWGSPTGIKNRLFDEFKNDKPDIIVFGHTHQPEKININNVLFINPGSPTDKFFTSINSVALLKIENRKSEAEIIVI